MGKSKLIFYLILIVILSACSRLNLKHVDVINTHGSIDGLERMVSFQDNVENGVPSDLRIVHYTIEGDPIVTDLKFDGKVLEVKHDSTRDKFGSGSITTKQCGKLIEEVNPANTSYIAVDCNDGLAGMVEILYVNYSISQQDLFEFELTYGVNNENEINTLTNSLKIIAKDVKREVYKKLVIANYLGEKKLTSSCEKDGSTNYFLKIHINGVQPEFQWNACDQGGDGVKFTDIANYIIEQSMNKPTIQPVESIQGYVLEKKDNVLLIGEDLSMYDYEWLKDELPHINVDNYTFEFIILEGMDTKEFHQGDKILATIEERMINSKPNRAKVKEIKKIEVH